MKKNIRYSAPHKQKHAMCEGESYAFYELKLCLNKEILTRTRLLETSS